MPGRRKPKPKRLPKQPFTTRIDAETRDRLEERAERERCTASAAASELLRKHA